MAVADAYRSVPGGAILRGVSGRDHRWTPTRRGLLRAGAGAAAGTALARVDPLLGLAAGAALRRPDSLPDPSRPAGTPTAAFPFDHIVCLMMENHSFDNYFGMLPVQGQPLADGYAFDAAGRPVDSQPVPGGYVLVQHATSECQPKDIPGGWTGTHEMVDGGRMDGFARASPGGDSTMIYWDRSDLPFYYSLASTFCLANRWFCSTLAPTFPNRRFYLAGTAFGNTETDPASLTDPPPPNGTLFDRLTQYGVSWGNYFVDLPGTGVIPSIGEKAPQNMHSIGQFFADCRAGTLPAVSYVDPEFGATDEGKALISVFGEPNTTNVGEGLATQGGDEENPQDIQYGESFAAQVVNAVLASPLWPRTLFVWLYDEDGGYYDHVPPPAAILPDSIPPGEAATSPYKDYGSYGIRVPAVVASPYSRPHAVTNVVHDHTSVLATIEAKWNLPACTYRDANATTVADFLDVSHAAFMEPPALAAAADPTAGAAHCDNSDPRLEVYKGTPPAGTRRGGVSSGGANGRGGGAGRLVVRFYGRRHALHGGLRAAVSMTSGHVGAVVLELRHGGRTVARGRVARVGVRRERVVLRPVGARASVSEGHYELVARPGGRVLVRRSVHGG